MTEAPLATPPSRPRRVAFLGTPASAVPTLRALAAAGFEIPLVVSRSDRRRGRGSKPSPSPVKAAALELGLEVSHDPYDLIDLDIDLGVVVAYGRLLRRDLLEQVAMLNVHFSILPRWRGAAPVERALLAGDTTTGVCIMRITEGLDEGPVYRCVETAIDDDESSAVLTARLADLGADLLVEVLSAPLPEPVPQNGEVTIAAKIDRSENQLDFSLPATELQRRVRIGRAWSLFRGDRLGVEESRVVDPIDTTAPDSVEDHRPGRLRLVSDGAGGRSVMVEAGDGSFLRLLSVKPAGRRAMGAIEWWNGAHPAEGEALGH